MYTEVEDTYTDANCRDTDMPYAYMAYMSTFWQPDLSFPGPQII